MGRRRDSRRKVERGDFQTPPALAAEVCALLAARIAPPRSIVEPTCGIGGLLAAALAAFPGCERALGVEIEPAHVDAARAVFAARPEVAIELGSFFAAAWRDRLAALAGPILVIGNPPWVTNADLGALASDNLPAKANADRESGIAALTGKSNFDISEAMLRELLAALAGRDATLAMLCKTSVARKLLGFAWRTGAAVRQATIARIDAAHHFDAAVEACLLILELGPSPPDAPRTCPVYASLADACTAAPHPELGYRGGRLVADAARYDRWAALEATAPGPYQWRSGIKHDCARVMELHQTEAGFANRAGDALDGAAPWLYPLWKSSEVARGRPRVPQRYLLVPHTRIGDDTAALASTAPSVWAYLGQHRAALDRRASAIYRGRPAFSIFGVGDYTFAPWKVAISGLYKRLCFTVIGPHAGQPVVFDDTCYFLACATEAEARCLAGLLDAEPAREFYASQVFWDAKRPITTELLRRLDLAKLAALLGQPLLHQPQHQHRHDHRRQQHQRADPDEAHDADLDAGAPQQIDP